MKCQWARGRLVVRLDHIAQLKPIERAAVERAMVCAVLAASRGWARCAAP